MIYVQTFLIAFGVALVVGTVIRESFRKETWRDRRLAELRRDWEQAHGIPWKDAFEDGGEG